MYYFAETFGWCVQKTAEISKIHTLFKNPPHSLTVHWFLSHIQCFAKARIWIFNLINSLPKQKQTFVNFNSFNQWLPLFSLTLSCNFFVPPLFDRHTKSRTYEFLSILCMCIFFVWLFYSKSFFSSWNSLNICQRHRDKKKSCRNSLHVKFSIVFWYFCIPEEALTSVFFYYFADNRFKKIKAL